MSVVLERLDTSFEEPEVPEPVEAEAPVEAAEVPAVEAAVVPEPPTPDPKKRGRPPKAKAAPPGLPPIPKAKPKAKPKVKAPKAPKPPSSEESESDVDETLRSVYNHVAKPDMETAILEFLVNRKAGETQKRKQLWSQLARM